MSRLFIADSDQNFLSQASSYLTLSGYSVTEFSDLASLRDTLKSFFPDLLLIARTLTDGDGLMFLKQIRSKKPMPIIVMGIDGSESERILSFELGCDDYVEKPLSFKELSLRINAHLRRMINTTVRNGLSSWILGKETLSLDLSSHEVFLDSKTIKVTGAEWRILKVLSMNYGNVISRTQLIDECFEYTRESYDRIIDTHIKNIRAKIGTSGQNWIETLEVMVIALRALKSWISVIKL